MPLSYISNKVISKGEIVKGQEIREGIFLLIKSDFPNFDANSIISMMN